ncbi:HAD family hydrolase [Archaeoglobus veneficus]|uniref:HAD family hydrolase n=1 Tax=Archaeoglobus veneficus TaxID=58290 RepID=UPI001E2969BD|nr:HAD family hydrolase [Archaeoglobus veneficus]
MFRAYVFDMDGTLVEFNLPFDRIREELGIKGRYILESIMEDSKREEKLEILKEYEVRAAKKAKLMPYAREILELLEDAGCRKGIVTRNCRESVEIIAEKFGLNLDFVITRDDAPPKPSPEPIKLALRITNAEPNEAITVGDYIFDVMAGKLAGTKTALLLNDKNESFAEQADYVIKCLSELQRFIP